MQPFAPNGSRKLDFIQRVSLALMSLLVLLTFVGANMQALLWQSSDWLVSTVLPAVVIDLTNDERSDNSVALLKRNSTLDAAAQKKAEHMAANSYFAHYAPDGTTPWSFFRGAGYSYAHAGENLAIHFTDSSEVVDAWMLSPAHRKNIVDPKFSEIGVGTAKGTFDGYKTVYVVQLFGTPAIAREIAPAPILAVSEPVPEPIVPAETVFVEEVPVDQTLTQEVGDDPLVLAEVDTASELQSAQPSRLELPVLIEPVAEETAVPVEPVRIMTEFDDVVVVETQLATSSGLAAATVDDEVTASDVSPAALATRPNLLLQWLYGFVALFVVISLTYALVAEARRMHYLQVVYSIGLLLVMGGLLWIHAFLTSGAVIA